MTEYTTHSSVMQQEISGLVDASYEVGAELLEISKALQKSGLRSLALKLEASSSRLLEHSHAVSIFTLAGV